MITGINDISVNGCPSIGPHITGSPKLIVSGRPVCTSGSVLFYSSTVKSGCLSPGVWTIIGSSSKMFVSGSPVAKVGDLDTDGGAVVTGNPKVTLY